MQGVVIGAEEGKARGAYSEAASSRFAAMIAPHLGAEVRHLSRNGAPFGKVASRHHPALAAALGKFRPGEHVGLVDSLGAEAFECVGWPPGELLRCRTLPVFGGQQYFRFLAAPPLRDAKGKILPDDPRLAAWAIPPSRFGATAEAVIAVGQPDRYLLIDGYLRSILWLRGGAEPLPVWVPRR